MNKREWERVAYSEGQVRHEKTSIEAEITEVIKCLWRLDSATNSHNDMNAEQKLEMAIDASSTNVSEAARKWGVSTPKVKAVLRDTSASIMHVTGSDKALVSPKVRKRMELLEAIELELAEYRQLRDTKALNKTLAVVPHVRQLVDFYLDNRSLRGLLDPLGISAGKYEQRTLKLFLTTENEKSTITIGKLSMRFLFANWSQNLEKEGFVSEAALDVLTSDLSGSEASEYNRLLYIKLFLQEMARQEYQLALREDGYLWNEMAHFFPRNEAGELDIPEMYRIFAQEGYCFHSLKLYAQMVGEDIPRSSRISTLLVGEFYSDNYRSAMNWAGIKFLENTLAKAMYSQPRKGTDYLLLDTVEILKEGIAKAHNELTKAKLK